MEKIKGEADKVGKGQEEVQAIFRRLGIEFKLEPKADPLGFGRHDLIVKTPDGFVLIGQLALHQKVLIMGNPLKGGPRDIIALIKAALIAAGFRSAYR